jgi:hypothetical protein
MGCKTEEKLTTIGAHFSECCHASCYLLETMPSEYHYYCCVCQQAAKLLGEDEAESRALDINGAATIHHNSSYDAIRRRGAQGTNN